MEKNPIFSTKTEEKKGGFSVSVTQKVTPFFRNIFGKKM